MNTPSLSPVSGWEAERERLRKALELAANRLQRCAIDSPPGTRKFIERFEWVEEARAALSESKEQTTADGWIEWKGGDKPPVDAEVLVSVRLRGSLPRSKGSRASRAAVFEWSHEDRPSDVVAYRVVPK